MADIHKGGVESIDKSPETTYHKICDLLPVRHNRGAVPHPRRALRQGTHMPKGTVVVDRERCKGCGLCIAFCPEDVLAYSTEYNRSGYNVVHMKEPERCIGCAFCAQTCPDVAIEVYREKKPQQRA